MQSHYLSRFLSLTTGFLTALLSLSSVHLAVQFIFTSLRLSNTTFSVVSSGLDTFAVTI